MTSCLVTLLLPFCGAMERGAPGAQGLAPHARIEKKKALVLLQAV
jgi:hypothetical protein